LFVKETQMARAHAEIGLENYRVAIRTGSHDLVADEGPALGGRDAGPAPYDLLLSSLAACTAITLRMYAQRKAWPLEGVQLALHYVVADGDAHIDRTITLLGALDDAQQARLAEIAEKTPVTLTLKRGTPIHTQLLDPTA
jgi:putative redox protein